MELPDIVFIHCHDLGRRLPVYGQSEAYTPSLTRLASEGMALDRVFSTSTMCSPSRGSILTGRYPHEIGLLGLTNRGWDLGVDEKGIPDFLNEAGYHTMLFGLQHEAKNPARLGYREVVPRSAPHPTPARDVADQVAARLKTLAPRRERTPVYVNVGFFEPHRHDYWDRYTPIPQERVKQPPFLPDRASVRADLARYDGLIEAMDGSVGSILAALDDAGMTGDTLVLFTTDHGIAFPDAKMTLYDAGIGVAALARWPGRIASGSRGDALVSHVDWLPTILEAVGADAPSNVRGVSFLPVLLGRGPGERDAIFGEATYHTTYNPMRCIRTERFKLIRNYDSNPAVMGSVEQDRNNGILGADEYPARFQELRPPVELFNLVEDPAEQVNLADRDDYAAVQSGLLRKLADWQKQTADPIGRLYATFVPDARCPTPSPEGTLRR